MASTSSRTCDADTSTAFFSSGVSAISKTFSTPPAPSCTGTPTYRPLSPYSPSRYAAAGSTVLRSYRYASAICSAEDAGE